MSRAAEATAWEYVTVGPFQRRIIAVHALPPGIPVGIFTRDQWCVDEEAVCLNRDRTILMGAGAAGRRPTYIFFAGYAFMRACGIAREFLF